MNELQTTTVKHELAGLTQARSDIRERFIDVPEVMARIGQMSSKEIQVFHALINGLTISNHGYAVNADIETARADGCIGALRREYNIPVDHTYVECISEAGNPVDRVRYFISAASLAEMESDPIAIFKRYGARYAIRKCIHENHDVKRLIETYGESGALRRVVRQAFIGKKLTSVDWSLCTNMLDLICDAFGGMEDIDNDD